MLSLQPFTPHNDPIGVQGSITLVAGRDLQLEFRLTDPRHLVLDSLRPHRGSADAFRADGLWNTTCFEAFWGIPGDSAYWELNLSASQPKWNLYHFQDYRSPPGPTESYDYELGNWETTPGSLVCLLRGKKATPRLEASLCVIVRTSATTHFYATQHAGAKPDYHLRKNFSLRLG